MHVGDERHCKNKVSFPGTQHNVPGYSSNQDNSTRSPASLWRTYLKSMVTNPTLWWQQNPLEQCKPRLLSHGSGMKGRGVLERQDNGQCISLCFFVFCLFDHLHKVARYERSKAHNHQQRNQYRYCWMHLWEGLTAVLHLYEVSLNA